MLAKRRHGDGGVDIVKALDRYIGARNLVERENAIGKVGTDNGDLGVSQLTSNAG